MIEEICRYLNNWFDSDGTGAQRRYFGLFTIADGNLDLSDIGAQRGQYFRIIGSVFNDGIYIYPAKSLRDETFDGAIWLMAIPKEVINIAREIEAWQEKYGSVDSPAMSPYNSESFGGYSYSKSSGSSDNGVGGTGTWQGAFASRLNKWRKIRSV